MRWEVFLCCGLSALFINSAMGAMISVDGWEWVTQGSCQTKACGDGGGDIIIGGTCMGNIGTPTSCETAGCIMYGNGTNGYTTVNFCKKCKGNFELKETRFSCGGNDSCTLKAYAECNCNNCKNMCRGSTGWQSLGDGRQSMTTSSCNKATCNCESTTSYRCGVDYYGSGSDETLQCQACPKGSSTFGLAGATEVAACVCIADYYKNDQGVCTECPLNSSTQGGTGQSGVSSCKCKADYYMENGVCRQCPDGATTNGVTGATSIDQCACPADTYRNGNRCTSCSDGATTNGAAGATDKSACVCKQNYYGSNDSCIRCPSGGVTAGVNTTAITSCYISNGTAGKDMTGDFIYKYPTPDTPVCSYQGT